MDKNAPYVLLALADLTPHKPYHLAERKLLRISDIMEFMLTYYDTHYASGTREMIRKGPIKELLEKNIIELNPDNKQRPTNSGKTVYAIREQYFKRIKYIQEDQ